MVLVEWLSAFGCKEAQNTQKGAVFLALLAHFAAIAVVLVSSLIPEFSLRSGFIFASSG
jgi:hypothetical protein